MSDFTYMNDFTYHHGDVPAVFSFLIENGTDDTKRVRVFGGEPLKLDEGVIVTNQTPNMPDGILDSGVYICNIRILIVKSQLPYNIYECPSCYIEKNGEITSINCAYNVHGKAIYFAVNTEPLLYCNKSDFFEINNSASFNIECPAGYIYHLSFQWFPLNK